MDMLITNA
jgi:hypothetical protein